MRSKESEFLEELLERLIRQKTDKSTQGNRYNAESEGNTPLSASYTSNLECSATNENNENLDTNFCKIHPY